MLYLRSASEPASIAPAFRRACLWPEQFAPWRPTWMSLGFVSAFYGDFWGHRGFTHSLVFAALLAAAAMCFGFWRGVSGLSPFALWGYFFLASASHGVLDAFTDGGLGVAFFSPLDDQRYFFPWTPIRVSPIGLANFLSGRGLAVLQSEFVWVWIPAAVVAVLGWILRREVPS